MTRARHLRNARKATQDTRKRNRVPCVMNLLRAPASCGPNARVGQPNRGACGTFRYTTSTRSTAQCRASDRRPPLRAPGTLSLLGGGSRALTAVAQYSSLFHFVDSRCDYN